MSKAIIDSTVIIHLEHHTNKMLDILSELGYTELFTTRINYLEILASASLFSKRNVRKELSKFKILEFTEQCKSTATNLAMQHKIEKTQHNDFLIATIALTHKLPLITENKNDFQKFQVVNKLKLETYKISSRLK